jgi:hypothetical protein
MLVGVGRTKDADTLKALYSDIYPQLADIMDVGGGGGKTWMWKGSFHLTQMFT